MRGILSMGPSNPNLAFQTSVVIPDYNVRKSTRIRPSPRSDLSTLTIIANTGFPIFWKSYDPHT